MYKRIKKLKDNPQVIFAYLKRHLYQRFFADERSRILSDVTLLNASETIKNIIAENKSLIRTGDGTFGYIMGAGVYFNDWRFRYNHAFAKKLINTLKLSAQRDDILFCIPHHKIEKNKQKYIQENNLHEWNIWISTKAMVRDFLIPGRTYGDSQCFYPKHNTTLDFKALKDYFSEKYVYIITSHTERFSDTKLGKDTIFIEAPDSDAWEVYQELESKVYTKIKENNHHKSDVLIMISAAEAAKVMVYDFANNGYTAWDTGQFFDLASQEIKRMNQ